MQHRTPSPKRQFLLEERARQMRHASTASEARLFEALRGKRLGVAVKRQVPLGPFIVDLLVPSARLVIEVDGGVHRQRRRRDGRRDRKLRRLGYRVLRLEAGLVMEHLEVALERVRKALGA